MTIDIATKGRKGEDALNDWLKQEGLSYVYICQNPDTFAPLFSGDVKRPDFLILLEAIGLIGVDAKNHTQSNGEYTLQLENEVRRAVTFERLFRIPIWYAYLHQDSEKTAWYWISALKAVEVGEVRKNSKSQEQFLAIKVEHFECIKTNDDLGKLYTHRLPSCTKIKKFA